MKQELELIDIWRVKNEEVKKYTWRQKHSENKHDWISFNFRQFNSHGSRI